MESKKKYIEYFYCYYTGLKIDFENPVLHAEKITCLKLFYEDDKMKLAVDKYKKNILLEKHGLGHLANEVYFYGTTVEELKSVWASLPEKFMLRPTHLWNQNYLIDKSKNEKFDFEKFEFLLGRNMYYDSPGLELAYKDCVGGIIAEKILNIKYELKIQCQGDVIDLIRIVVYSASQENMKVKYERTRAHFTGDMKFIDGSKKMANYLKKIDPAFLKKILDYSKILAQDFESVRVDFFVTDDDRIILSEYTFYDNNGIDITNDVIDKKNKL